MKYSYVKGDVCNNAYLIYPLIKLRFRYYYSIFKIRYYFSSTGLSSFGSRFRNHCDFWLKSVLTCNAYLYWLVSFPIGELLYFWHDVLFYRIQSVIICLYTASSFVCRMKELEKVLGGCLIQREARVENPPGEELRPWTTTVNFLRAEVELPRKKHPSSLGRRVQGTARGLSSLNGLPALALTAMMTLITGVHFALELAQMLVLLVGDSLPLWPNRMI